MANPTTNRPTRPVFDSSLGFGATAKAFVDCCQTVGTPIELVGKTVGRNWEGLNGAGVGRAPWSVSGGFTHTPSASRSTRFGYGSPATLFPGRGFITGDGVARTWAAVVRVDWIHAPGVASNYSIPMVYSDARGGLQRSGFYFRSSTSALTLGWASPFTFVPSSSAINLTAGRWYAIAFSTDQTASPFSYRLNCYDYTAQALHTVVSGGPQDSTSTTSLPLVAAADLIVGSQGGGSSYPFRGEFACVLLDKQYWSAANFQSFYEDPWATVRGTYNIAGTFTAPTNGGVVNSEGGITLSFPHATGTGTSGTGAPTYYLQRYTSATASVSSGARIATLTPDAGGAIINYFDSSAVAGTLYYYRLECVDGSSTVYYPASSDPPIPGRRLTNSCVGVLFTGDSRSEGEGVGRGANLLRRLNDGPVNCISRAKSGNFSADWCNGTNAQCTFSVTGGTPSSGVFNCNISLTGGSNPVFRNIPYNCSAALLKTILEDNTGTYTNGVTNGSNTAGIGGSGNVTATGGPLPGTPIVVVFNGATSANKANLGASLTNSTLNAGTPTIATDYTGTVIGSTYLLPAVAEAVARQTDEGIQYYLSMAVGTNDGNNSTPITPADYGARMASMANYAVAQGLKVVLNMPPMVRSGSSVTLTQAKQAAMEGYRAQLAALHNGTTIFFAGTGIYEQAFAEPLGTFDGLHSVGNEDDEEWDNFGYGIYRAISPASGGGSPVIGGSIVRAAG